ncbi:MAG: hypothetical protein K0S65_1934 [Labilithrix sp.]|nr:hypothetical protein [Labilithrix sp.]
MGKINVLSLVALGALATIVACAQLAGIDDSGSTGDTNGGEDGDGGAIELANGLSVSPQNIALTTSCAGAGETKHIALENKSATEATYELQVPEGSAFALRDDKGGTTLSLKGTLPARQVVLVYLQVTSTKAGTFDGQVIVRVGEQVSQLPVSVTVNGGALALSPSLVDFGEVRKDKVSAEQTVEITNTGTEAVNVTGFRAAGGGDAGPGAEDFEVKLESGSVNIAAGQKTTAKLTLRAGPQGDPLATTLEPMTQTPTCGALPALTLKGQRVNQDVTVNPAALDFDEVDCNSASGGSRTITVTNFGGGDVSFNTSTTPSSWFTVSPSSGTVPKAKGPDPGTAPITVTLKPLTGPIGDHEDPITIDIGGPQPKITNVVAKLKSVGAVLSIQPTTLDGFTPDQTRSFSVRNDGNKFITARHTSSNTGAFAITGGSTTLLFPGVIIPLSVSVKFVAQTSGQHSSNITTARESGAQLCSPPATVVANGSRP